MVGGETPEHDAGLSPEKGKGQGRKSCLGRVSDLGAILRKSRIG